MRRLALYATLAILTCALVAPPLVAQAQGSRADDELAEAQRLSQEAARLYYSARFSEGT